VFVFIKDNILRQERAFVGGVFKYLFVIILQAGFPIKTEDTPEGSKLIILLNILLP